MLLAVRMDIRPRVQVFPWWTELSSDCQRFVHSNPYSTTCVLVGDNLFVHATVFYQPLQGAAYRSEVYKFNLTEAAWKTLTFETELLRRDKHAMKLVDDCLYIYGGDQQRSMHKIDILLNEYSPVKQHLSRSQQDRRLHFGRRTEESCELEYHERTSTLILLEGMEVLPRLQTFHVDKMRWESLRTTGTRPSKRKRHASCVVGDSMYVFGGKHAGRDLTDLYVLKLGIRSVWSTVLSSSIARDYMPVNCTLSFYDGWLLIYGSRRNVRTNHGGAGLWLYDLENKTIAANDDIVGFAKVEERSGGYCTVTMSGGIVHLGKSYTGGGAKRFKALYYIRPNRRMNE